MSPPLFSTHYTATQTEHLLIIAKEDLDTVGKEGAVADLEAVGDGGDLLDLVVGEGPTVEVVVGLDAALGDGLGDDADVSGQAPLEEDLLGSAVLGLCNLEESLVGVERGVGAAQARVGGGVDAL